MAALLVFGVRASVVVAVCCACCRTPVTERQSVRVARNVETSVAFLPFVFTAVAFGPLSGLWRSGIFANALDFRRPYLRWAIYIPARGLTGAFTGLLAAPGHRHPFEFGHGHRSPPWSPASSTSPSTVFFNIGDTHNHGALLRLASTSARSVLSLLLSLPLLCAFGGLMVYGYRHYSFWTAAMFLGPTLALQRVVHLYQRQRDVSQKLVDGERATGGSQDFVRDSSRHDS